MSHFVSKTLIIIGCVLFFGALAAYAVMLLVSALNWIILSVIFLAVIVFGLWLWYKGIEYRRRHRDNA